MQTLAKSQQDDTSSQLYQLGQGIQASLTRDLADAKSEIKGLKTQVAEAVRAQQQHHDELAEDLEVLRCMVKSQHHLDDRPKSTQATKDIKAYQVKRPQRVEKLRSQRRSRNRRAEIEHLKSHYAEKAIVFAQDQEKDLQNITAKHADEIEQREAKHDAGRAQLESRDETEKVMLPEVVTSATIPNLEQARMDLPTLQTLQKVDRHQPVPTFIIPSPEAPKHNHTQALTLSSNGKRKRTHLEDKPTDRIPGIQADQPYSSNQTVQQNLPSPSSSACQVENVDQIPNVPNIQDTLEALSNLSLGSPVDSSSGTEATNLRIFEMNFSLSSASDAENPNVTYRLQDDLGTIEGCSDMQPDYDFGGATLMSNPEDNDPAYEPHDLEMSEDCNVQHSEYQFVGMTSVPGHEDGGAFQTMCDDAQLAQHRDIMQLGLEPGKTPHPVDEGQRNLARDMCIYETPETGWLLQGTNELIADDTLSDVSSLSSNEPPPDFVVEEDRQRLLEMGIDRGLHDSGSVVPSLNGYQPPPAIVQREYEQGSSKLGLGHVSDSRLDNLPAKFWANASKNEDLIMLEAAVGNPFNIAVQSALTQDSTRRETEAVPKMPEQDLSQFGILTRDFAERCPSPWHPPIASSSEPFTPCFEQASGIAEMTVHGDDHADDLHVPNGLASKFPLPQPVESLEAEPAAEGLDAGDEEAVNKGKGKAVDKEEGLEYFIPVEGSSRLMTVQEAAEKGTHSEDRELLLAGQMAALDLEKVAYRNCASPTQSGGNLPQIKGFGQPVSTVEAPLAQPAVFIPQDDNASKNVAENPSHPTPDCTNSAEVTKREQCQIDDLTRQAARKAKVELEFSEENFDPSSSEDEEPQPSGASAGLLPTNAAPAMVPGGKSEESGSVSQSTVSPTAQTPSLQSGSAPSSLPPQSFQDSPSTSLQSTSETKASTNSQKPSQSGSNEEAVAKALKFAFGKNGLWAGFLESCVRGSLFEAQAEASKQQDAQLKSMLRHGQQMSRLLAQLASVSPQACNNAARNGQFGQPGSVGHGIAEWLNGLSESGSAARQKNMSARTLLIWSQGIKKAWEKREQQKREQEKREQEKQLRETDEDEDADNEDEDSDREEPPRPAEDAPGPSLRGEKRRRDDDDDGYSGGPAAHRTRLDIGFSNLSI